MNVKALPVHGFCVGMLALGLLLSGSGTARAAATCPEVLQHRLPRLQDEKPVEAAAVVPEVRGKGATLLLFSTFVG